MILLSLGRRRKLRKFCPTSFKNKGIRLNPLKYTYASLSLDDSELGNGMRYGGCPPWMIPGTKNCGSPSAETLFSKLALTSRSIHLNTAEDTFNLGVMIAGLHHQGRLVIALIGNLGAGKTTFTQGLAQGLGIDESVSSPTFLMLSEYHSGKMPLYHFDLYRLQEDLDLESQASRNLKFEFDEIMESNKDLIAVVEWMNLWESFNSQYDQLQISIEYTDSSQGQNLPEPMATSTVKLQALLGGRRANVTAHGQVAEKVLLGCQENFRLGTQAQL